MSRRIFLFKRRLGMKKSGRKLDRKSAQVFEGIVSVAANAVLFAAKFWAGLTTGSIALMADAWHTASDSLTSIFVVFAAKLAAKKPDKEHPFGHGRWELIASIVMAGVLAVIGWEFVTQSIERLQHRESVEYGALAIVITVASIVLKELLAQLGFYLGRRFNNPVITADGWHSRSDALSSGVVLVGIIITQFTDALWWMDSVLGIFCAAAIFFAAYQIMKEVIGKLLGEEPDEKFIADLNKAVVQLHNLDLELHHIHLHNYITHKELTLHIRLPGDMTIEQGHDIATEVEKLIAEEFNMEATTHIEPRHNSSSHG
jgi:cation diffusion facilitator family transporter